MAYVPLNLRATDVRVNAAISMFTEDYLEQAHHLLSRVFGRDSFRETFGLSAAVMTLLAIASASTIRYFDPATGKNSIGDGDAFKHFVDAYFPWDCLGVTDDQHRPEVNRRKAAIKELYAAIRNPLIHAGGVVGLDTRTVQVRHVFPGLSDEENEQSIEELCRMPTLNCQTLIEMRATATTIHTRELYWGTRRAVERFSADSSVESDIQSNLIHNKP